MGQRGRILSQVTGFLGFKVVDCHFENEAGGRVEPVAGYAVPQGCRLVLTMSRVTRPRAASVRLWSVAVRRGRHDGDVEAAHFRIIEFRC